MADSVLVVGGGPSGLMAAITAARVGAKVTVLEANEKPGRKLLATGNGKCNLTNMRMDPSVYRGNDTKFIQKVIAHYDQEQVLAFFSEIGLATINKAGWIYPRTEQASSVLDLLLMEATDLKIKIKTKEKVEKIYKELTPEGKSAFVVKTGTWQYIADTVVIACGSPASSVRGASDDVNAFADFFQIRREEFLPALVPLKVKGDFTGKWAGIRTHASVTLVVNGKKIAKDTGELQLTEYGISGIPVFQISRFAVHACREKSLVEAVLNFFPEWTEEELRDELATRVENRPDKSLSQMLVGLLPDKLIPIFIAQLSGGQSGAGTRNLSAGQLSDWLTRAAYRLRHFKVKITGAASLGQAQICSGGILAEELKESMESKSISGLFFCGESVDADGPCGGYNLQWAWSSGYTAGISAAYKGRC
uniref:NAD(P)/FAD-dependent oxidoreductase n=1 Tax=Eubacterium cellulosolvens TaxID=29322 RepID=UPI0004800015|nr:aminoacetone oxidase family FAD-binding enzyme [[Eubacterium] cellulosolvens]